MSAWARRTLVSVVLLGAALVVADVLATGWIERRVATAIADRVDVPPAAVAVDLGGPPAVPRLLIGGVPAVDVAADGVPVQESDGRLTRVDAQLTDVTVDVAALLGGGASGVAVSAGAGAFTAVLEPDDLLAVVDAPLGLDALEPEDGAVRAVLAGGITVDLAVEVEPVDTADGSAAALVLRPQVPLLEQVAIALPLDGLPEGVTVDGARAEPGRLVLTGTVDGDRLLSPSPTAPGPAVPDPAPVPQPS